MGELCLEHELLDAAGALVGTRFPRRERRSRTIGRAEPSEGMATESRCRTTGESGERGSGRSGRTHGDGRRRPCGKVRPADRGRSVLPAGRSEPSKAPPQWVPGRRTACAMQLGASPSTSSPRRGEGLPQTRVARLWHWLQTTPIMREAARASFEPDSCRERRRAPPASRMLEPNRGSQAAHPRAISRCVIWVWGEVRRLRRRRSCRPSRSLQRRWTRPAETPPARELPIHECVRLAGDSQSDPTWPQELVRLGLERSRQRRIDRTGQKRPSVSLRFV